MVPSSAFPGAAHAGCAAASREAELLVLMFGRIRAREVAPCRGFLRKTGARTGSGQEARCRSTFVANVLQVRFGYFLTGRMRKGEEKRVWTPVSPLGDGHGRSQSVPQVVAFLPPC